MRRVPKCCRGENCLALLAHGGEGDTSVAPTLHSVRAVALVGAAILAVVVGCRKEDMADQPRYDPMAPSRFFADGQSARPLVAGTVPRGGKPVNDSIFAVTAGGPDATEFPFQLTAQDLEIGHKQFNIFCSPCHGGLGDGNGVIVQRGFPRPPSYYLDRLRNVPPGHFYNVISHGYGAMYSYNERIAERDRWRIVGYIRALQLSDPNNHGQPSPTTQAAEINNPRPYFISLEPKEMRQQNGGIK